MNSPTSLSRQVMKQQHVRKEKAWGKTKNRRVQVRKWHFLPFSYHMGIQRGMLGWVNQTTHPSFSSINLWHDSKTELTEQIQVTSASQGSRKLIPDYDPGLESLFLSDSYMKKPETVACFPWLITCLHKRSAGFPSLSTTVKSVPARCFIWEYKGVLPVRGKILLF